MEFKQAHRLENLHVSGTRVVFGKCAELAAQGIPVTALTLGQPDCDTPQYIIDACKKALDEGKTRYTDGSGIQELKEAVCQKLLCISVGKASAVCAFRMASCRWMSAGLTSHSCTITNTATQTAAWGSRASPANAAKTSR